MAGCAGAVKRNARRCVLAVTAGALACAAWNVAANAGQRRAAPVWRHGLVTKAYRGFRATLSFDVRAGRAGGQGRYRSITLSVWLSGRRVATYRAQGGPWATAAGGWLPTQPSLTLEDVWGSRRPEAVLSLLTGGQNCCQIVTVAWAYGRRSGAVTRSFGQGWHPERHRGGFYFLTWDQRFRCKYTSCATSATPVQIVSINTAGTRFVDVTESRLDIVRTQATALRREYARERGNSLDDHGVGALVAWCADEFRLGARSQCRDAISSAFADRRLRGSPGAFFDSLRTQLTAWGYG
jgi:hypothetical protein